MSSNLRLADRDRFEGVMENETLNFGKILGTLDFGMLLLSRYGRNNISVYKSI